MICYCMGQKLLHHNEMNYIVATMLFSKSLNIEVKFVSSLIQWIVTGDF